ncbi:MAG: hypothetical protein HWN71_03020 [Desulfobacterales bacterium]|nr:hypothetical protein [Desulfobacterales bacterium]
MRVSEATRCFLDYHRMNSNTNTIRSYELVLALFLHQGDLKTILARKRFPDGDCPVGSRDGVYLWPPLAAFVPWKGS